MKRNMGYADRAVRFVVGIILVGLVPAGHIWGLIGIVPILTAAFGVCPAYCLIGVNTDCAKKTCCGKKDCKKEEK